MTAQSGLRFLEDRWDDTVAAKLDAPELLRYRSNLLGSDLRITNFGGGNTSSKLEQVDPLGVVRVDTPLFGHRSSLKRRSLQA